tara:strand:+ start:860 stop:2536 length:1677 start_codon:yes stop_codon:yes gene_type:complete
MAILEIEGKRVEVDDKFLSLSIEEQQSTVDEIASRMGSRAEVANAQPSGLDVAADVGKAVGSGIGRGAVGILDLPELAIEGVGRLGQMGLETAGFDMGERIDPFGPTLIGGGVRSGLNKAGLEGALDYRGESNAAKFAGTISEFAAGGGALGGAGKLAKLGAKAGGRRAAIGTAVDKAGLSKEAMSTAVVAGAGSEAAGQATEGSSLEPFARIVGAIASPTVAARTANVLVGKPYNTFIKPRQLAKELNTGNAGVDNALANAFTNQNAKSQRVLKDVSYAAADKTGDVFSQKDIKDLYYKMDDDLLSGGSNSARYDAQADDHISKALDAVFERTENTSTSLIAIDNLRQQLRNIAKGGSSKKGGSAFDPRIGQMVKSIDDLIQTKAVGSPILQAARIASMRTAKLEIFEDILSGSKLKGSGSYVKSIQDVLKSPNKLGYFDESEIKAMEAIVSGKIDEKVLRGFGSLSPLGEGGVHTPLALISNVGLSYGAVATGNPGLMAVGAATILAKPLSGAIVRSQIQDLKRAISMGSPTTKLDPTTAARVAPLPGQLIGEDQQ